VIGTGGVGLNAVQGAVIAGATTVVAVDVSAAKLETALAFGATHAIDSGTESVTTAVASLTGGAGVDHVIVTVGAPGVVEQGSSLLRRGGTMVIVGMPASGVTASIDPGAIANDGQRILGSKMGSARVAVDIPRLAALYREGRLKLDELISGRYPLSHINAALATAGDAATIRNVIVF
jgi:Zn-dependent alcohol dehydrogenase